MKPRIQYFKNSTTLQVRIDMPDGKSYGIQAPASTEHEEVVKLVNELVESPKSRRVLDEKGGVTIVPGRPDKKVRIYKEMSK